MSLEELLLSTGVDETLLSTPLSHPSYCPHIPYFAFLRICWSFSLIIRRNIEAVTSSRASRAHGPKPIYRHTNWEDSFPPFCLSYHPVFVRKSTFQAQEDAYRVRCDIIASVFQELPAYFDETSYDFLLRRMVQYRLLMRRSSHFSNYYWKCWQHQKQGVETVAHDFFTPQPIQGMSWKHFFVTFDMIANWWFSRCSFPSLLFSPSPPWLTSGLIVKR